MSSCLYHCPGWCGGSVSHTGSARAGAGTRGTAGALLGTGWSRAGWREDLQQVRERGKKWTSNRKSCSCVRITTDHQSLLAMLSVPSWHHADGQLSHVPVPQSTASMGLSPRECLLPSSSHLTSCLPIRDDCRVTSSRSGRKDPEAADCAAELLNDRN